MSTSVWPPLPAHELKKEEEETTVSPPPFPLPLSSYSHVCLQANKHTTQAREISWLLESLQETLVSLKAGLEECYALLAPIEPGSTLVLSSPRSECIKGHVTRVGTRVVKGVCLPLFILLFPPWIGKYANDIGCKTDTPPPPQNPPHPPPNPHPHTHQPPNPPRTHIPPHALKPIPRLRRHNAVDRRSPLPFLYILPTAFTPQYNPRSIKFIIPSGAKRSDSASDLVSK
jgi:hypothetical protein